MAKKAFIVGINTLGLKYCFNDAALMKEVLEKRGYQTTMVQEKMEKLQILSRFEEMLDGCDKTDTVIFYFSGHGIIDRGRLYLITGETFSNEKNKIPVNTITDPLERCNAIDKLIILDCCHAGRSTAEWTPSQFDAYRILIAANPLEQAKELEDLQASFMSHRIHQALTNPVSDVVDDDGKIRINALSLWLRKEAEHHNGIADSKKVPLHYLMGSDRANIEIVELMQEEIRKISPSRNDAVNSSHGLKAGASLLLPGCCAVIALWHRGTFCGNFRFPFHWPKLTSDSRCSGSDLIGHIRGVPSLQLRVYRHATHLIRAQIFQVAL